MPQSQQENLCEICEEPNGWVYLGPEYEFCCGVCIEENLGAECEYTGIYRRKANCNCGKVGAINYEDDRYYCGGSPGCVP